MTDGGVDLLSSFDFSAIEDMDPSVADGYRVIYDREVPFELRVQESADSPQQVGTLEATKVKILLWHTALRPTRHISSRDRNRTCAQC